MRTKAIFLVLGVLMLSFLPAYVAGVSTPDRAAAETAERSALVKQSENPAIPAAAPAGVSSHAALIRNLWGASTGETVDLDLHQASKAVGWSWSREHPVPRPGVDYVQPIYPNARIVLKSPVTVGEIQSFNLVAGFDYTQPPTGIYNLAYDIFLREKGMARDNRKSEIMVWLDWTQTQPPRSLKGCCSDGSNNYQRYSWTKPNSFDYHSFLLALPPGTAPRPVNLKALIDLVEPEKDWYISEVELGTEVWSGSGTVELTTYYLELNGSRL
jgi:hypothetical protein